MRLRTELSIALLIVIALCGLESWRQPITNLNGGLGRDGRFYFQVAAEIAGHQPVVAEAPFVYRLGTPALAAWLSAGNLIHGFRNVNLAACFILAVLLTLWLRLWIRNGPVRIALLLIFFCHWTGPLRFTVFYPCLVDPWAMVWMLLALLLMANVNADAGARRIVALSIVVAVGVIFREVVLLLAAVYLVRKTRIDYDAGRTLRLRLSRFPKPVDFLPLAAGLAALITTHRLVHATGSYHFVTAAVEAIRGKSLGDILYCAMAIFGPVLIIVLYDFRAAARFLWAEQWLLFYLCAVGVLGWIGGTDTERFLFWGIPALFVLSGRTLEQVILPIATIPLMCVLIAAQAVVCRVFSISPGTVPHKVPVLAAIASHLSHRNLDSSWGSRLVLSVGLAEQLIFAVVVIFWLRRLNARRQR